MRKPLILIAVGLVIVATVVIYIRYDSCKDFDDISKRIRSYVSSKYGRDTVVPDPDEVYPQLIRHDPVQTEEKNGIWVSESTAYLDEETMKIRGESTGTKVKRCFVSENIWITQYSSSREASKALDRYKTSVSSVRDKLNMEVEMSKKASYCVFHAEIIMKDYCVEDTDSIYMIFVVNIQNGSPSEGDNRVCLIAHKKIGDILISYYVYPQWEYDITYDIESDLSELGIRLPNDLLN